MFLSRIPQLRPGHPRSAAAAGPPMPHVSPGRITHRTAGGWPKDCQQAWAPPSGEATFSTLSHGIGRQTPSISRPSFRSGRTQSLTGRQSLSSQHEMPLRLRRPVYQPCAPAGAAAASRTKRMRPAGSSSPNHSAATVSQGIPTVRSAPPAPDNRRCERLRVVGPSSNRRCCAKGVHSVGAWSDARWHVPLGPGRGAVSTISPG